MVGTTRPRIGYFLKKFKALGLIEVTRERYLILRESKLAEYLARLEWSRNEKDSCDGPKRAGSTSLGLTPPVLSIISEPKYKVARNGTLDLD